jgi:hypothetical protein
LEIPDCAGAVPLHAVEQTTAIPNKKINLSCRILDLHHIEPRLDCSAEQLRRKRNAAPVRGILAVSTVLIR